MQINFDGEILAADTETRTLRGLVVPFGQTGNTSAGPVQFEFGAFGEIDASQIVLNLEHDRTKPLGRGISGSESVTPKGISMAFKLANTQTATDALVEAAEGLRSSFSIEATADEYTIEKGVMKIVASTLTGVAHVTNPAFKAANITEVAASEDEETEITEAESAAEDEPQENIVETENTASAADEVTASAVVQAAANVAYTKPRSPIVDGASYLDHSIKAALGSDDSKMYIRAADDDSSTNTGLTLAPHMNEFITSSLPSRPAFEAVRTERLVDTGLSFTIPRLTAVPTVADTNENQAPSETGMTSDYLTVAVNKFAGQNTISWELIDRSGPAFMTELMREMQNAYALATDKALIAAFTASGTQATGVAATAAGLQSYVATETAAAYKATGKFAQSIVASPDQWGAMMGYVDDVKRPLYVAAQPQNASGSIAPTSVRGQVLGLDLIVDHGIVTSGVIDESAFIVAREAVSVYESPTTRVQVQVIGSGQVEVALYGYLGIAVKQGAGVRRFNLT
jgi:HK97 family phage major capsid protein